MVNMLATRLGAELAAPACRSTAASRRAEDTAKIKAAMLIHYAGTDERINAGWPA